VSRRADAYYGNARVTPNRSESCALDEEEHSRPGRVSRPHCAGKQA
jgi:hypothetical protein